MRTTGRRDEQGAIVILSRDTQIVVDRLFPSADRDAARVLLEEQCADNLPCLESLDPVGLERYRFAALRVSGGDLGKLHEAVALAKLDWRDLLMAADFGHDANAHRTWFERGSEPGEARPRP